MFYVRRDFVQYISNKDTIEILTCVKRNILRSRSFLKWDNSIWYLEVKSIYNFHFFHSQGKTLSWNQSDMSLLQKSIRGDKKATYMCYVPGEDHCRLEPVARYEQM